MNYIDADFVRNELTKINKKGEDISIDWLSGEFEPASARSDRIARSIALWRDHMPKHFTSHQIDLGCIKTLHFIWKATMIPAMSATDDRGELHIVEIAKTT